MITLIFGFFRVIILLVIRYLHTFKHSNIQIFKHSNILALHRSMHGVPRIIEHSFDLNNNDNNYNNYNYDYNNHNHYNEKAGASSPKKVSFQDFLLVF